MIEDMVPQSTLQYLRSQNKEDFLRREKDLEYKKKMPERRREQVAQIRKMMKKNERVILYGTGLDASGIAACMEPKERSHLLFCDKKAVEGEFIYEGVPVIAPDQLFSKYCDQGVYITSTEYAEEIFEELMCGGIAYSNIAFNPYPWFTI